MSKTTKRLQARCAVLAAFLLKFFHVYRVKICISGYPLL